MKPTPKNLLKASGCGGSLGDKNCNGATRSGKIFIPEKLEKRILHGLACEWEKALWVLSPHDQKRMRPPLFSLRDMDGQWGYWSSEKREISLSRILVWHHSWEAVREVLLHEMAHQYAEEVLISRHEPPHGPQFRQACSLLRANPQASGRYPPLDDRPKNSIPYREDKIMLRVKKLLALAESRNRYEADAAMAKAHELIARYNIDLPAQEKNREYISLFTGRAALRHSPEDYSLAHLLQDFYFVQGIWVSTYVLEKGKTGRVLEISGTPSNVKVAGYVYDFVQQFIRRQWSIYNDTKSLDQYRRTDFALGIVDGFRLKLESQKKAISQKVPALMRTQDPLLVRYMVYKYPHTIQFKKRGGRPDTQVWKDGNHIGKELIIFKGIREYENYRGHRITS
jgi:hypothetical protein